MAGEATVARAAALMLMSDVLEGHRLLSEALPKRLAGLGPEHRARAQRLATVALRMLDQLNIVMTGFILAKQKFAQIRKIYIRAGAAFLLVSIPATYWFGVWGMAFTMLFVVEVLVLFFSFRILREPQDLHQGAAA